MSPKIKWLAWGAAIILLVYTRFVNLSWGLPFPFHPDERNLANAVQSLSCDAGSMIYDLRSCFNPHFFAYGQFPIYLSYIIVLLSRVVTRIAGEIRFEEAVMALRFISAIASIATAYISFKILKRFIPNTQYSILYTIPLVLSPALIQFAHFGTTESLLMMFFSWLILLCIQLDSRRTSSSDIYSIYIWIGAVTGLAIATKVSSLLFAVLPFVTIISTFSHHAKESRYERFWLIFNELVFVGFITGATAILFSPYNLISWKEFTGSIDYESMVASGKALVFYTRTFTDSAPVLFQFQKVFPYALGWPVFATFLAGFAFLPWKRNYNLLRVAFLLYFLPTAFLYTKWTRFMAPILPLMVLIAALFASKLPKRLGYFVCILLIIPGIMFLKIYILQDVRFQASEWMAKNIPKNSYILQETANVVDLPVFSPNSKLQAIGYKNISFNYYELDADRKLQEDLQKHLRKVDYIIVPSRRIFKNHSRDKYPVLNKYYDDLFSGKLGFTKVAEYMVLDDEDAEETWTVFDHPVIRIFKRI